MPSEIYDLSFSRNIGIFHREEQLRLARATVAVVGTGGVGGNAAVTLARMGVGRFRLADFDTFDLVNINRQYGARVDTRGCKKIEVLAEELRGINPSVELDLFPDGFTDECADALLGGADVVLDAVDFYAIDVHLKLHRDARRHGKYVLMGSPVGFSACLQVFDPNGMSLEEYCGITPEMPDLERQLRYACGLVPELAHIEYFDVSAGSSNTNFLSGTGPSLACACGLASSLVASEAVIILLDRRKPRSIPHAFQFDPYTFRYEKTYTDGGMRNYDPDPVLARIADKSSLVAQVFELFYRKSRAEKALVDGRQIYYRIQGTGPDLLLLSPLGSDSGFWARQTQALSGAFRVITFDPCGSGASSPTVEGYSTSQMAGDAIALLDHLGATKVHVVGLALGGLVAQELAIRYPERVDRMVLASTYAHADDVIADTTEAWRRLAARSGMTALFDACLEWLFSPTYIQDSEGEIDKLKTFFRLTLQDPTCFAHQSLAGVRHDSRARLHAIRSPALVLHGGGDRLVSEALARQLASGIPDATFRLMDGAPHFLTWEHARQFNAEVIEFLRSSPPR